MQGSLSRISLWLIGAGAVLVAMYYVFVHRHMRALSVDRVIDALSGSGA